MELAGICLISKNVRSLAEFYQEVFNVKAEGDDTHMQLITGGGGLAIFSVDGMESMAPGSMKGVGYGSVVSMFRVKDVDSEYEKLKSLGVEFIMLPTTHPWGARSFWFKDPDGNIVDFYCEATR